MTSFIIVLVTLVLRRQIMLIFRIITVFWISTRTGLYASMLRKKKKNTSAVSYCPVQQHYIPAVSERLFCFQAPLTCSDWSAHTRLSQHCSYLQSSCAISVLMAKLAARHTLWKCVTWWHVKVKKLKSGLLMRRFRISDICGREELLLVWTLTFQTFNIFYKNKHI